MANKENIIKDVYVDSDNTPHSSDSEQETSQFEATSMSQELSSENQSLNPLNGSRGLTTQLSTLVACQQLRQISDSLNRTFAELPGRSQSLPSSIRWETSELVPMSSEAKTFATDSAVEGAASAVTKSPLKQLDTLHDLRSTGKVGKGISEPSIRLRPRSLPLETEAPESMSLDIPMSLEEAVTLLRVLSDTEHSGERSDELHLETGSPNSSIIGSHESLNASIQSVEPEGFLRMPTGETDNPFHSSSLSANEPCRHLNLSALPSSLDTVGPITPILNCSKLYTDYSAPRTAPSLYDTSKKGCDLARSKLLRSPKKLNLKHLLPRSSSGKSKKNPKIFAGPDRLGGRKFSANESRDVSDPQELCAKLQEVNTKSLSSGFAHSLDAEKTPESESSAYPHCSITDSNVITYLPGEQATSSERLQMTAPPCSRESSPNQRPPTIFESSEDFFDFPDAKIPASLRQPFTTNSTTSLSRFDSLRTPSLIDTSGVLQCSIGVSSSTFALQSDETNLRDLVRNIQNDLSSEGLVPTSNFRTSSIVTFSEFPSIVTSSESPSIVTFTEPSFIKTFTESPSIQTTSEFTSTTTSTESLSIQIASESPSTKTSTESLSIQIASESPSTKTSTESLSIQIASESLSTTTSTESISIPIASESPSTTTSTESRSIQAVSDSPLNWVERVHQLRLSIQHIARGTYELIPRLYANEIQEEGLGETLDDLFVEFYTHFQTLNTEHSELLSDSVSGRAGSSINTDAIEMVNRVSNYFKILGVALENILRYMMSIVSEVRKDLLEKKTKVFKS